MYTGLQFIIALSILATCAAMCGTTLMTIEATMLLTLLGSGQLEI